LTRSIFESEQSFDSNNSHVFVKQHSCVGCLRDGRGKSRTKKKKLDKSIFTFYLCFFFKKKEEKKAKLNESCEHSVLY